MTTKKEIHPAELAAEQLRGVEADAMRMFLYDGRNYSLKMESKSATESARVAAAYATMLREQHPPKVKSFSTARARLNDLISGDINRDISPALIIINCKDLTKTDDDKYPWIVAVVDKVINDFATLYSIKPPNRKDPLNIVEARATLAQMKQRESVKFQTVIFTNVDALPQEKQLSLCNIFLGRLADTRSLNAFLVHETDITHMMMGPDGGNVGAAPLSEARWFLKDLSGQSL